MHILEYLMNAVLHHLRSVVSPHSYFSISKSWRSKVGMSICHPSNDLRDRYAGCLLGAVVGDCLGSIFECQYWKGIDEETIKDKLDPGGAKMSKRKDNSMKYTDDTAMTHAICCSLLESERFNAVHLAKSFTTKFAEAPGRGYGSAAKVLLSKWRKRCPIDSNVYDGANEMFEGAGSYGNGAAMRVAPVALFSSKRERVIKLAMNTALLTHSHKHGYRGAILQVLAVHHALAAQSELNWKDFLRSLKLEMMELELESADRSTDPASTAEETNNPDLDPGFESFSYEKQLELMEELLSASYNIERENDRDMIIEKLGNGVSAMEAVPAAIYSFLRNMDRGFEACVYYAISLGGDTDTIASMCAAIAGAYYGRTSIPEKWVAVSEGTNEAAVYAEQLYKLAANS